MLNLKEISETEPTSHDLFSCLTGLIHLQTLTASYNQLAPLNTSFLNSFDSIVELRLLSNKLTIFPELSVIADTLRTLYLSWNRLVTISPGRVSSLVNLQELILVNNRLTTFPFDEFVTLSNFFRLDLTKNKIESLPDVQGLKLKSSVSFHSYNFM